MNTTKYLPVIFVTAIITGCNLSGEATGVSSEVKLQDIETGEILTIEHDGVFQFLNNYKEGDNYNISILETSQGCELTNEKGKFGNADITDLRLTCEPILAEGECHNLPAENRQAAQYGSSTMLPRIVHGNVVEDHEYPWLVKVDGCTGALLAPNWVMTAAHCYGGQRNSSGTMEGVDVFSLPVQYGSANKRKMSAVNVKQVFIHPEYRKLTAEEAWGKEPYDVALLELEDPVYLDSYILLPDRNPEEGENLIAAGWGETEDGWIDVARQGIFSVRPHNRCFNGDEKRFCTTKSETMSSHIGGGDSGGPVFMKQGGCYMMLGTNSTSSRNYNGTPYATHAQTYTFIDWINGVMGIE